MDRNPPDRALRRVIRLVIFLNAAYFGIEFAVARSIGSVSLFADSIDFLEDACLNVLVLLALSWSPRIRGRVGRGLALILLVPGLATLWTAWKKLSLPVAPDPALLSFTGTGALAVNLCCALLLARYRHHRGSLTKATFMSARNDAVANIAIVATGLLTANVWPSAWPDLAVGLAIAAMNADSARAVWQSALQDSRSGQND